MLFSNPVMTLGAVYSPSCICFLCHSFHLIRLSYLYLFFLLPDRVLMAGVPCSWAGLGKCDVMRG
ncbi:hypothetical protein BDQ94DRAFT_151357 [Aspergillus welwitschiae]|uniref:Uncharacterized protein n=1 Tax=Aspergillus welwitschiae TaxID=1341132 RepID=A0A3F3PPP6_9EURO|nr:hypothetical protein BDQ94DRAFT_151357 [Aspergillus welwitschiae]RDH28907.1 hypothetical protein BDQ94DRAFT_151357 [Aspergillus welwitschiae]